jgi:adenylate cyclase class IV
MTEIELKAVVDDMARRRSAVERAGGKLEMEGRLEDRRYDMADGALKQRDHVLRVRVFRDGSTQRASLEWKGPARSRDGYRLREEIGTGASDPAALMAIVERLGFVVTRAIDRHIAQYSLEGATVRFERYPRMDDLVEVEGQPDAIERAVAAIGIPRSAYNAESLPEFVERYQQRTGQRAAISDADLAMDRVGADGA